MTVHIEDYDTVANHGLITQVAKYYNSTKQDIEDYRDMELDVLEQMSIEHLLHWKVELHRLIFDGMNCSQRSA